MEAAVTAISRKRSAASVRAVDERPYRAHARAHQRGLTCGVAPKQKRSLKTSSNRRSRTLPLRRLLVAAADSGRG